MRFEVEVNGRTRNVTVERGGVPGRFRLVLDGAARLIDAARLEERSWSIVLPEEGSASWRASVAEGAQLGELVVQLGGAVFRVTVNGRRSRHSTAADGSASGG